MRIKSLIYIVICAFLYISTPTVFGQVIPEKGAPYIRNYPPSEYRYSSQTWAVAKDNCGIMYFGCNEGVLEFDGVNWRLIETEMRSHVRSLALDSSGLIYVGASNDFGYLGIDKLGSRMYYSLKDKIDVKDREFSDVWSINSTSQGIYFFALEKIFRWYNDTITTIPVKTELFSSVVKDKIYVLLSEGGIGFINRNEINILPHTEEIGKNLNGIVKILPYLDNKLLIVTDLNTGKGYSEFFIYDLNLLSERTNNANTPSNIIMPLKTEVDEFLKRNYLYDAERIDKQNYALGTTNGGILIINEKGEFIRIINSNRGLQNNSVHDLFIDENKNIWASLNKGISFIDIRSGISVYNEYYGINEMVNSIFEYKNNIYFGSFDGIYSFGNYELRLNDDKYSLSKIENYSAYCFDMVSIQGNLFAASNNGILKITNNMAQLEVKVPRLICFEKSSKEENRLFLGLYPGFAYVDYTLKNVSKTKEKPIYKIQFLEVKIVDEIYEPIVKIVNDKNGGIWLVTAANGLIRFQFNKKETRKYSIQRYGIESGLSQLSGIGLFNIQNDIIACLDDGAYKANYNSTDSMNAITFKREKTFGAYFNNSNDVSYIIPDPNNNLWIGSVDKGIVLLRKKGDNSWEYIDKPFKKIPTNGLNMMYLDSNNILWVSTNEGVFRINTNAACDLNKGFNSIIRKVTAKDSVLFKGTYFDIQSKKMGHYTRTTCMQPTALKYQLDYTLNSLKFEYASTFYESSDKIEYEYFLEGFDTHWSSPSHKMEKEYTNLPEGDYCFKVRSTNVFESESNEAKFYFTILPPWYRTLWAYFIFLILCIAVVAFLIRINTIRLKRLNKRLEEIIRNRTKEIQEQRDELQLANATKDKFFGIIAHDLRNPFNTILGFSHIILNKIKSKDYEKVLTFSTLVHKTSEKAYQLLENLLTWSRSQSGQVKFNPEKVNIKDLIDSNVYLLIEPAKKKGISLLSTLKKDLFIHADRNMILTIIRNLITNAIKFSKANDSITITVEESDSELTIHIADTGVGMEEDIISKLFKIGENIKTEGTNNEPGTGLGLLLCKEFVDWHKGDIWVKSKVGKGSTFSFTIPKNEHD